MILKKQPHPNQQLDKLGYPIAYRWRIDASFDSMPQKSVVGGVTYICINPFEFTRRIIALWHADEPRMSELTNHRLGEINPPVMIPPPISVKAADPYP